MAKIIAVANQKGGVGKTTTAVNVVAALGASGAKVLLVDLDPQGNATVGSGIPSRQLKHTMKEVLLGERPAKKVVLSTEWSYDVLPGNGELTVAEVRLLERPAREQSLKQALEPLMKKYQYIIIDCPPSLNMLTLNAMVAADSVLVPIQCEYYALEGLTSLLGTIEQIKASANPDLYIEGLVRTMFDGRNRLARDVSDQLTQHFADKVYQTTIPRNVRVAESPSHGAPVVAYDPQSLGGQAYLALGAELIRRQAVTKRSRKPNRAAAVA